METVKDLVLLSRFSESPESLPAFLLCIKLVKKGHHVYVTTTTMGKDLIAEFERAKQLTEEYDGSIELLLPKFRDYEKPSPEWIQNLPGQYFSCLSQYNVDCIYGTLPGTAQTAVELKDTLNCKVILLATCKLGSSEQNLRSDNINSARAADDVWSMGPDIYTHYKHMFQAEPHIQHQAMVFMPDIDPTAFREQHRNFQMNKTETLVSIWSHPIEFFHYGTKTYSQGRDIEKYYALSTALGEINAQYKIDKVQWNIHSLEKNDRISHDIRNHASPQILKVTPLGIKTLTDILPWADCLAFIVPDQEEETFNFFALTAIWLGIPTIVSSQSSIGKFLLSLDCPEKFRAVVNLTGDPQHDTTEWSKAIKNEILSTHANPKRWAATLSRYLQMNKTSWEPILGNLKTSFEPVDFSTHVSDRKMSQSPGPVQQNIITAQTIRELAKGNKERWAPGKSQANNCSQHIGTPITLYCKICDFPLCKKCEVDAAHISHPTMKITEKYHEMTSNLTALQKECTTQEKTIKDQLSDIIESKSSIETSTQIAIEKMSEQKAVMEQEIVKSFEEQVKRIANKKEEALTTLYVNYSHLQRHNQERKEIYNHTKTLLRRSGNPNFITEVSTFVNFNHLSEVPTMKEPIRQEVLYQDPSCKKIQDPEELRTYVKEKIIGYFVTQEDEHQPYFDMPAEAQMGELKRFSSTKSVGGDSAATAISATSRMSGLSHGISQGYLPNMGESGSVDFISSTHIRSIQGSALKAFSNVFFADNTLWICGWNRNLIGAKTVVLLNVDLQEYNLLKKEKKMNSHADMPTTIVPFDDKIIFTMKNETEVFSFNPKTSTFKSIYSRPNLKVAAMCATDSHMFLLSQKETDVVHIFNSRFQRKEKVTTGLMGLSDCSVDMCVLKSSSYLDKYSPSNHTIVISTSSPHGSVRAVSIEGQLWEVDGGIQPLDAAFSPHSISSNLNGDIFVADKENDKVLSPDRLI